MSPDEQIRHLTERVTNLEAQLGQIIRPSLFRFVKPIVGGTDGMRIGTAATDKLGFYGVTPIVQPTSDGELTGWVSIAGSTVKSGDQFSGNVAGGTYSINGIVKILKAFGLLT